jgi:hypothetical protein
MATQNLSVTDPAQVSSAKMLEVFIGSPPKRMLIFTGIAIPEWDSNGNLDSETVIIDLNAESNAPNPQFAATVGLASIYNQDSDLVFATNDAGVFTAPKATPSGTKLGLFLGCDIAVLGESSVLNRFSYQATVFLDTDTAQIAGTIRWDPNLMTHNAAIELDLFDIQAYTVTLVPGPPGGFATATTTIVKVGKTTGKPDWIGSQLGIPYVIDEPPLGESLFVAVTPKPGAFVVHSTGTFNFVRVSGPSPIELSISHLVEKPVDFEPRQLQQPH